jgi:hypothetical protein
MTSPWPIEDAELDDLNLDLRNVRILDAGSLDQSAIASYMVEAEDVLDLARNILREGYLDNELPVVVDENARRVVLEGNRRVTALKAIRNPALLGASAPRMDRLLSRYPEADTPTAIRVMVAPSRDAAQQLLARLHTGKPKKSWLREQQAIFYHAQLSPTVSLDELRALYPGETANIASFIRMGEMRDVIRGLRYNDRELEEFVKTSQLKMTSFEYAYERPGIQDVLGLEFGKDGRLKSKRLSKDRTRGLIYLLQRFKTGTLSTRSPELKAKGSAHDQLVEQLRQVVNGETGAGGSGGTQGGNDATGGGAQHTGPSGSGTGSGNGSHAAGGSGAADSAAPAGQAGASGGTATAGSRNPNRGDTRSRLDMDGFEYKGTSAGMRRRFEELSRLNVGDFPNAAYDLLRTVLECAIKDHFAAKGQRLTGQTLGPCLQELNRAYQGDRRMISLINAVNRKGTMPANRYSGTALALNSGNHEPDSFAGGKEVHEAWERIKPILVEIVGK